MSIDEIKLRPFSIKKVNTDDYLSAIPSDELMANYGNNVPESYLKTGIGHYQDFEKLLKENEIDLHLKEKVLDFGCRAARVMRHLKNKEVWGCDVCEEAIKWCIENMPFNFLKNNANVAHLPFEDNYFDLVYAMSVFSHMDIDCQSWIMELSRITKKGGHIFMTITTKDSAEFYNRNFERFDEIVRERIDYENLMNDQYEIISDGFYCFMKPDYFLRMCKHLQLIDAKRFVTQQGFLFQKI